PPGALVMSSGSSNFSFGKASSVLYGLGGSGEPWTRDVIHGTRWAGEEGAGPFERPTRSPPTVWPRRIARSAVNRTSIRRPILLGISTPRNGLAADPLTSSVRGRASPSRRSLTGLTDVRGDVYVGVHVRQHPEVPHEPGAFQPPEAPRLRFGGLGV